ncbi:MAG TPA: LLM class flavin-dependent oxidoreductase [Dehalococcoidia bacterium]|nr:LLM class flavin-dependent oxidoreductase [Dehalococcoidia bacterium]
MRTGLSWDLAKDKDPVNAWNAVLDEIGVANGQGYDSAWVDETRDSAVSISSPSTFMTAAAARTTAIQLRSSSMHVTTHHFVRLAEEIVIVDLFSKGRAGISFAAGSRYGADPEHVHETIDFVQTAWSADEFRYSGKYVRFPLHTPESAPRGPSEPTEHDKYVPQWEWGPATPDFLAITPKPYAVAPPVSVEIDDDATLEWAARNSVSPFVRADIPTTEAVERLARYRAIADAAGQRRSAVEPTLERRVEVDGSATESTLAGSSEDLVNMVRTIKTQTGISHFVWRRTAEQTGRTDLLLKFAGEVQPMLQA